MTWSNLCTLYSILPTQVFSQYVHLGGFSRAFFKPCTFTKHAPDVRYLLKQSLLILYSITKAKMLTVPILHILFTLHKEHLKSFVMVTLGFTGLIHKHRSIYMLNCIYGKKEKNYKPIGCYMKYYAPQNACLYK